MQMIKAVFSILLHTLVRDREERIPATCIHPTEEIYGSRNSSEAWRRTDGER